jgi:hypothetical protein
LIETHTELAEVLLKVKASYCLEPVAVYKPGLDFAELQVEAIKVRNRRPVWVPVAVV